MINRLVMAKKLTSKQICKIMVEENERQHKETSALLKKICLEHPCGIGPIIDVTGEPAPNYDLDMRKEDVYRELARLNYRGVLFAPSALNSDYLKTILPLYDSLIPLIDDKWAKKIANQFRDVVAERLDRFEKYSCGKISLTAQKF